MITVYIGGGLANKMFQFAFSLAIKKSGYDVGYDVHTFKSEFIHDSAALQDIFPNIEIKDNIIDNYIAAGKHNKLYRLWKLIMPFYVTEHSYQYNYKVFEQLRKDCYVESSWQDERYFRIAEREVREAFTFAELDGERNREVMNDMKNTNSIAIHIRKGDGYGTWDIFSNTCPKEYYGKAITYIKEHVENPKFFIFTDNPKIVKEYLDLKDYTLINWNPTNGWGNHFDMQLMSNAKHNIIANSTYSWWGAWLNPNPGKIVIGPLYWFNPKCKLANINHIIPQKWIKL